MDTKDNSAGSFSENGNNIKIEMRVTEQELSVCLPITSLTDLWTYLHNPPDWTRFIINRVSRSPYVIKNVKKDCHTEETNFAPKVRIDLNSVPKTLVCHDMMNGYHEDRFVEPVNVGNKYVFYRWAQIDVFVYFSHNLVTIPPLCWINLAHKNGVQILGTFITEWNDGEKTCDEILESISSMQRFAKILVDICILFRLDGWLLNIENKINNPQRLRLFVQYLTEQMHMRKPDSLIIWYDSVIEDGSLSWQNELNERNRCYFDACDGIFVNYTWTEANMERTKLFAQHRSLDVYVGVDVFGRNSYGGGKFNTYKAAEKIRDYNFSMAIFAQGWTYETLEKEPLGSHFDRFLDRDNAFWKSLWPFLYTHPICDIFGTSFFIGVDKNWYKPLDQEQQLSRFLHPNRLTDESSAAATLNDTCSCLQFCNLGTYTCCLITETSLPESSPSVHRLFDCDITMARPCVLYVCTKSADRAEPKMSLILLVRCVNGSVRKVVCAVGEAADAKKGSEVGFRASERADVVGLVRSTLRVMPVDWKLSCFPIDVGYGRILEIGARLDDGIPVYLCALGFKQIL